MAHKKILLLEAAGGVFTAAASLFMQHLYSLSGQELLGILFGAVNGSVWEACKTLLFPFLIWALLEALKTLRQEGLSVCAQRIRPPKRRYARTAVLLKSGEVRYEG